MKSSLQWMKEYVNIDYITDPQQFADTLTIAGIPVEQVEYWGPVSYTHLTLPTICSV